MNEWIFIVLKKTGLFDNFDNFLALCTLIFAFILHWFTTVWSLFSLQLIKPWRCYGNMLRQVNSQIGEYIPLSNHRKSTKNHLEIGKAVLPIQEILQNYYSMESGERRKTLKTSFRLSHDILFHLRIFFFLISFMEF